MHSDKTAIDQLTATFYSVFCNKEQPANKWDILFRICIPAAIIIKKNGTEQTICDVAGFIAPRKIILTDGTLTGFEEGETEEQTVISNNIAQRLSRYQKSGYLKAEPFSGTGTKLFQFINTTEGWKITAVCWEDDLP